MLLRVPWLWLILILLTIGSFALAERSVMVWVRGVVLAITALKGYLIVDGFMELHGHRHIIRYAMNLYCPLICLFIWLLLRH